MGDAFNGSDMKCPACLDASNPGAYFDSTVLQESLPLVDGKLNDDARLSQ